MAGSVSADVDTSTFDAFVAAHALTLLRAAWLLTGDRSAAEDLLQTTWSQVWPRWASVVAMEFPAAYVRTAMVRAFVSSRRRRWWSETAVDEVPEVRGEPDAADDLALRQVVAGALARLTARQRAVVVLRYFDDLDVNGTADALGCSVGTVKSQTAKALARLRADGALANVLEDL